MTDSNDTRPISVAELLAKNGTIGAPVSGRRRRRRGNSDAVTVAELTGEIPIVKVDSYGPDVADVQVTPEPSSTVVDDVEETSVEETSVEEPHHAEKADEAADLDAEPADLDAAVPVEADPTAKAPVGAEEMSPDPVGDEDVVAEDDDADLLALSGAQPAVKLEDLEDHDGTAAVSPAYAELFGGHIDPAEAAGTQNAEHDAPVEHGGSPAMRAAWTIGQSVLAVAFGAGMFFAFDQLWRWNMIVALVLSVLVILGLVVGVRVVRKSDDLASTLTAVVVGALVTFGPLALLTTH